MSIYIRYCLQWCVCKVGTSFSHKDDSCTLSIHDAFFLLSPSFMLCVQFAVCAPAASSDIIYSPQNSKQSACSTSQSLLEARLSNSSNPCLTSTSLGVSTPPVLHFVKRWNYDFEIDTEDPTGSDFFKSGSLQCCPWKTLCTKLQFRSGYPNPGCDCRARFGCG